MGSDVFLKHFEIEQAVSQFYFGRWLYVLAAMRTIARGGNFKCDIDEI
jgi:hypothetical protein